MNAFLEFQGQAAQRDWRIVSVLKFALMSSTADVNATAQLKVIKNTGRS